MLCGGNENLGEFGQRFDKLSSMRKEHYFKIQSNINYF